MRYVVLMLLAVGLSGCTNGFSRFYESTIELSVEELDRFVLFEGDPEVFRTRDFEKEGDEIASRGYEVIGHANFYGPHQTDSQARSQARRVGASIVLIEQVYRNTRSGSTPLTLPTSTTTYSNTYGSGTIGNYGTPFTYNSSGYSTTYGTQTTYIPYHIDIFDYRSSFWAKLKPTTDSNPSPYSLDDVIRETDDSRKR